MSTQERIRRIIEDANMGSMRPAEEAAREIAAEFVIIAKADLPAVKRSEHDENTYHTDGQAVVYTSEDNAQMWCLRDIAVWEFIKAEGDARTSRREELAGIVSPLLNVTYSELSPAAQNAIDYIIKLEAAK